MTHQPIFDFDDNFTWGPQLSAELSGILPSNIASIVSRRDPEFIEDAADIVLEYADKQVISAAVTAWLKRHIVLGYHGTRLTPADVKSVQLTGLQPLIAADRSARISRALCAHPRWEEVKHQLADALHLFGPKEYCGGREGQVHATISRAGLVDGFNHYLKEGAEFDSHVAYHLLGQDGRELISKDGDAYLVTIAVPGEIAFAACNRYGIREDEIPNLIQDIFNLWSYWLVHPAFNAVQRQLDCGLVFKAAVPPTWISSIEKLI